jgi:hypothetical protein
LTSKEEKPKNNLQINSKSVFNGTNRRNQMMQAIVQMCREQLPMPQKEFINIVAFNTGLTTRKVQEDYLDVLVSVHVLQINKFNYELGESEKNV